MAGTFGQRFGALIGGLMLLVLGACSPVKVLNALTPDDTFDKTVGIAYGDDPRQKLDVYVPRHPLKGAPVVVFFYGGSWNSGNRGDYTFVGEALASRGIVAVLADYRLYPQVRYPLFLEDGARAVAWTKAHISEYSGNPQRLYLMGHSSGAYNASMLALDTNLLGAVGMSPKDLSGWIGLAGPYDFLPIENPDVRPVFFWPDSPRNRSRSTTSAGARRRPC
jgi:acetyl esterase/lipase